MKGIKTYNLLLREDFTKLSFNPSLIRKELESGDKLIVIDEIQRIPELLDEVHYLIEEKGIKFLLTGSSARRLKRQSINLLGGRARQLRIHPFSLKELNDEFDIKKVVNYGLLPGIYFSNSPEEDLDSYIGLYLEEEIAKEGAARSLLSFSRFLEVAALCNAEILDYTSVSNDAQIARSTIYEYFRILEDTLIGHFLPAWGESKKRKPIASNKFYFFDWGLVRKLQRIKNVTPKSEIFGKAFETYMFHEIKTFCDYNKISDLHFWRTYQQDEVDFIIDNQIAVEVKSGETFKSSYLKSLFKLKEEKIIKKFILVYTGKDLTLDDYPWLKIMNYKKFIKALYEGEIL